MRAPPPRRRRRDRLHAPRRTARSGGVSASAISAGSLTRSSSSLLDDAAQRWRQRHRLRRRGGRARAEHRVGVAALRRVPAIDGIAVVRGEERELVVGIGEVDLDRRREAAQQRRHGARVDAGEAERLRAARVSSSTRVVPTGAASPSSRSGMSRPSGSTQADGERNVQRQLVRLAGRRRRALRDVERVGRRGGVERVAHGDDRRAGLRSTSA